MRARRQQRAHIAQPASVLASSVPEIPPLIARRFSGQIDLDDLAEAIRMLLGGDGPSRGGLRQLAKRLAFTHRRVSHVVEATEVP